MMLDLRKAEAIERGWSMWVHRPPPKDEIVECRRLSEPEFWISFWVKPRLLPPEWNCAGVVWRPVQ